MKDLTKGQRFLYTGDRANHATFGTITEVTQQGYAVTYDNERFENDTKKGSVSAIAFSPGIGRRFITLEDYNAKKIESAKKWGFKEGEITLAK